MRNPILAVFSSLVLLVALVFLVLSLVSVPIAQNLHLASSGSTTYGIFGSCEDTTCSQPTYPINVSSITNGLLMSDTRNTLVKTFIVAPIAAGLVFFAFFFTVLSVCVSATVVKILSLILSIVAAISTTLIGVLVILVYYPHVEWLAWLQIVAAGLCVISLPLSYLSKVEYNSINSSTSST